MRALQRSYAALQQGDLASALTAAQQARDADRRHPEPLLALGGVFQAKGDAAAAGDAFSEAMKLAPADPRVLNAMATWQCQRGQRQQALALFDRAIAVPGNADAAHALVNAGVCAFEGDEATRAEAYLRLALAQSPREPLALISMARLQAKAGNALSARGFLQRREALGPLAPIELQVAIEVERAAGDARAVARYERQLEALLDAAANASQDAPPSVGGQ